MIDLSTFYKNLILETARITQDADNSNSPSAEYWKCD